MTETYYPGIFFGVIASATAGYLIYKQISREESKTEPAVGMTKAIKKNIHKIQAGEQAKGLDEPDYERYIKMIADGLRTKYPEMAD